MCFRGVWWKLLVGWPWKADRCPHRCFLYPPPQQDKVREEIKIEKTWRSLTHCCHGQKRLNSRKNNVITNWKRVEWWEMKTKPASLSSPQSQLHTFVSKSSSSCPTILSSAGGWITASVCCSFFLALSPWSATGSSKDYKETTCHELFHGLKRKKPLF